MANIKSQEKRNRTNEKARMRNASAKSAVRTAIKKVRKAVESKDYELANKLMQEAYRLIDKSVFEVILKTCKNTDKPPKPSKNAVKIKFIESFLQAI